MTDERSWQGCVFVGVSVDGFIARSDGDFAWLSEPRSRQHAVPHSNLPALVWDDFFPSVDAIVMGRMTYEITSGFGQWPYRDKQTIVLSRTLDGSDSRVRVVRTVAEAVAAVEGLAAARVYVDGGRTIQSFLAADLIDEITVAFAPVLLGGGIRLFGTLDRDVLLTVRGSHVSEPDGLVRVTYDVVHGDAGQPG